jgi:hypothetical protein
MPRRWQEPTWFMMLAVLAVACSPDDTPVAPNESPSFSHTGPPDISGQLLGEDGGGNIVSICSLLPASSLLQLRPIVVGGGPIQPTVNVFCPTDTFSIPVIPGTYQIRVTLPSSLAIGSFPLRYLEPTPIVVGVSDVVQDITIRPGIPVLGGGTVDGNPTPFVTLNAIYADFSPAFAAGFGTSGASGAWVEPFGRTPMILQPNVNFSLNGCFQFAGTRLLAGFPTGPVSFPGPSATVSCEMETGDAAQFTHSATFLAASILPGDIGGLSPELSPTLGLGYGVQFPQPGVPIALPFEAPPMQLFRGGLLLGVNGSQILSGVDQLGFDICIDCRDFGPGAVGSVQDLGGGNRLITWQYDDSHSSEAVGLSVLQESFDGTGASYVLVRFAITNNSGQRLTLDPGLFMDWDIEGNPGVEQGAVELGGQLVYMTTPQKTTSMGTMIFAGGPPRGAYFVPFPSPQLSIPEQIAILRGQLRRSRVEHGDTRYFQGGAGLSLELGETKEVWVAVIGGTTVPELISNARIAAADVANRQSGSALARVMGTVQSQVTVPAASQGSMGTREIQKTVLRGD